MTVLLPLLTEHDVSDGTRQDVEPDLEWKNTLRRQIEDGLRSTVEKAMLAQDAQLGLHMMNPADNARFAQDHVEIMVNIRCLAKDHYRHALERERQERKWALERQALLRDRQVILEAIERKGDLQWQYGMANGARNGDSFTVATEPPKIANGAKRTAPQRAQSKGQASESAPSQPRMDLAQKFNNEFGASLPLEQDRSRDGASRYQSPNPLPQAQASPLVWRPSLSSSSNSKPPTPPNPAPNHKLPEFWRPTSSNIQSHEPDEDSDHDEALTSMLPPELLQRPPMSTGNRQPYKSNPGASYRGDADRYAGPPLRPASRMQPPPQGLPGASQSPHGPSTSMPAAGQHPLIHDQSTPSPLSLWLQNLQGATVAPNGGGQELEFISTLVASEQPAFPSSIDFDGHNGNAEALGYAEVFTRQEAEAGRQQADVQWLKEKARFNPAEARRREEEARRKEEEAKREEEELIRRAEEARRLREEEQQREEESRRNEEVARKEAQSKKREEPSRGVREAVRGKGQAKKGRRAQETAKSEEAKGAENSKNVVVEETEAQRETLRREREAAKQQEFIRREQEITRRLEMRKARG